MNYNKESGYGKYLPIQIKDFATGKIRVVGDSNAVNKQLAQDIFNTDPDGEVRFYATIQAGIDACTANAGDVVFVLPGYSETITAQIDLDKAGVKLIGLGFCSLRPSITGNGTIDCFDVSAANVWIENIQFAAPETDAQTSFINVDAANCTI